MGFAEKLKELRIKSGISTTELAKLVNMSQSAISKLENGQRRIDLDTLEKICNALGVPLEDFFSGSTSLPPDLQRLLNAAKELTPEQREQLTKFIQTMKGN